MPKLGEFLFGKKDKLKQLSTMNPQQQQLLSSILSQLTGMQGAGGGYNQAQQYYQNLLEPSSEGFENFSSPYLQQFKEQILPQIAERFAGAGALSSSGFGQALGGASAGLQSQLAQLYSALQSQAADSVTNQFNQLSKFGLSAQPFAYQNKKGSMGLFPTAIGSFLGSEGFTSGLSSKIFG